MEHLLEFKNFLLLYAGLTVAGLILVMRRRRRKGMLLRLRGGGASSARMTGRDYSHLAQELRGKGKTFTKPAQIVESPPPGERSLNVVFNYNGETWDAYEVLGLPAGSGIESVDRAFKEMVLKVDPSSRPFIEAAARAIRNHHAGRKVG